MEDLFRVLSELWYPESGASTEIIDLTEQIVKRQFPADYKRFLQWSNGGDGPLGIDYLSILPVEEIKDFNEAYLIQDYLPHILGIGTNGGGSCFGFDYRMNSEAPTFILVPLGDLEDDAIIQIGTTFQHGIESLLPK